jgi:hypothetical protein
MADAPTCGSARYPRCQAYERCGCTVMSGEDVLRMVAVVSK